VIVVGGPGAVWPFPAAALAGIGPVWQSLEPELDLAVGACWWTRLRRAIEGGAPPVSEQAVLSGGAPPALAAPAAMDLAEDIDWLPGPDLSEVPPWER
jgi:hypothetical protein